MSCHGCAGKFGILNKELGCPSCGFAFCSKCLRFKAIIPKLSTNQQYKVCRSCHNKFTSSNPNEDLVNPEPPEAFIRRLESLDDPSRPPITVYRHSQKLERLKSGLEDADREIVERLEKLKQERRQQLQRMPTDDEMFRRLATLKGEDPDVVVASSKKSQLHMAPDTRSSEEKVRGLLEQYTELQQLDSKRPNPVDEIAERLAKLRGESHPTQKTEEEENNIQEAEVELNKDPMSVEEVDVLIAQIKSEMKDKKEEDDSSSVLSCLRKLRSKLTNTPNEAKAESDDEAETDRIIQKAIDEIALEEDLDELEMSQASGSNKEELPWCIICNEDATIRCLDCEEDLYCSSCFRQGHDEWDIRDHHHEPYRKPRSHTNTQ